jgi:hypothetical protein
MPELDRLIGEWEIRVTMEGVPPDAPGGRVTFEWMPGGKFVIERWEVPVPEAPDGLAVIGPHEDRDGLVQHYFDSRGVHRVYDMTLEDGVWKLWRDHPGFDQRYTGTFTDDGNKIEGAWEMRNEGDWFKDFDLDYVRVS